MYLFGCVVFGFKKIYCYQVKTIFGSLIGKLPQSFSSAQNPRLN